MNKAEKKVLQILTNTGVVIADSHIVYTSGKHGSTYVNKDAIYPHTKETSFLCKMIADWFRIYKIKAVIAPAVGGIILSQWVAYHLSRMTGSEVLAIYAEKSESGNAFIIRRGYDAFIADKRVIVVEDILNTGASAKKVILAARALGAEVVGLGALCNRGNVAAKDVGNILELFALVNMPLDAWDPADCHLCKDGIPINVAVGNGREHLASKQKKSS